MKETGSKGNDSIKQIFEEILFGWNEIKLKLESKG